MNSNTIAGYIGGTKRNQIASFALASAAESAILVNTDTGTTAAILTVPQGNAIVGSITPLGPNANSAIIGPLGGVIVQTGNANNEAPWFSTSSFDLGRIFVVTVVGTVATGTGATNTISLYQGTSSAVIGTAGNVLSTLSVPVSTTGNFIFTTTLRWDVTSAVLVGSFTGQVANGTPSAVAVLTHTPAVTTAAGLSFLLSATGGAASSGTIAVSEFYINQG